MPYLPQEPRNELEQAAKNAGYPYFSTVWLRPGHEPISKEPPFNRLDSHGHHSANTHLIKCGSLNITPIRANAKNQIQKFSTDINSKDPRVLADKWVGKQRMTIDANNSDPREWEAPVGPYTAYKGMPGSDGAWFVEAHTLLSPDTAERFEKRGDLTWEDDDNGQTREQWCMQERARKLQQREPFYAVNFHGEAGDEVGRGCH